MGSRLGTPSLGPHDPKRAARPVRTAQVTDLGASPRTDPVKTPQGTPKPQIGGPTLDLGHQTQQGHPAPPRSHAGPGRWGPRLCDRLYDRLRDRPPPRLLLRHRPPLGWATGDVSSRPRNTPTQRGRCSRDPKVPTPRGRQRSPETPCEHLYTWTKAQRMTL